MRNRFILIHRHCCRPFQFPILSRSADESSCRAMFRRRLIRRQVVASEHVARSRLRIVRTSIRSCAKCHPVTTSRASAYQVGTTKKHKMHKCEYADNFLNHQGTKAQFHLCLSALVVKPSWPCAVSRRCTNFPKETEPHECSK